MNIDQIDAVTVIGCGNMGSALANGFASSGLQVVACDTSKDKLDSLQGATGTLDLQEAVSSSKTLIIAVKPNSIARLLKEIKPYLPQNTHIISVAAGVTIASFKEILGDLTSVSRVMPNIPALVGEGATSIFSADKENASIAEALFSCVGKCVQVEKESDLNATTALGGSGPAFISLIIDSLAEGGVTLGLSRETSLELAIQTVMGTAHYLAQSNIDPATLIKMVSSPGGTTVEGLRVLNERGTKEAFVEALRAASKRAEELESQQ